MIYRKERPHCRKVLLNLMEEYDCKLEDLLYHPDFAMSKNLRIQCRKMIEEGKIKTAKEINQQRKKENIWRMARMIK